MLPDESSQILLRQSAVNQRLWLQMLVESASDAIVLINQDGTVAACNPGAERILGCPAAEIRGQAFSRLAVFAPAEESVLEKVWRGAAIESQAIVRRTKSGEAINGLLTAWAIEDDDGKISNVVAVIRDAPAGKQAGKALRESEERMQIAVEAAGLGTWEWHLTTNQVFWNEQHFRLFKMPVQPNPLTPDAFFAHVAPEERERIEQLLDFAVREKGVFDTSFRVLLENNETRWMSGYGRTIEDADGRATKMSGVMFDCTETRRAEDARRSRDLLQKLVRAGENERKRFARDLHEGLGQQLTALRLRLETIRLLRAGDTEICSKIDDAQTLARVIDRAVDFLSWKLRPATLDDFGLVPALERYVKEWSDHTGITAKLLTANLPKVRLLPELETHLYRIAQEALNNTGKHARAQSAQVLLEKRGDAIVLIIADDGSGFNPDDKTERRQNIGLCAMRERAELLGGTLEIESSPGSGTVIVARVLFMPERRAAQ